MAITSVAEINREIAHRCAAANLRLDCGSDGIFNAEIAIIGEAPGERERINKIPLCGASGKYLWDEVRSLGINRRSVYITNVVKRQLLQERDKKDKISRGEIEHYAAIVNWELQQLPQLRYVICLGNYALEAVTGLTGIDHHRGSVYHTEIMSLSQDNEPRPVTVLAMYNPAYALRNPKIPVIFKFDVARLGRVLRGQHKEHVIDTHINPSPAEAMRFIERMQEERLPVGLDIETIGGETACIGLANSATAGMCINFRDRTSNRFSVRDESAVRTRLHEWFNEQGDTRPRLVMQNGMFDASWLYYKDRIKLPPSYFDTMLAHHTLYPELPHNLGFLTAQYTEHPFYKDDKKEWREGGDIDTFWKYNGKDCSILIAIMEAERRELESQGLAEFFFSHVMRLQPHLIGMTVGGVAVDALLKERITLETRAEVSALREKWLDLAREATGEPDLKVNPNSPKQLAELYFGKLRLHGRGVSTDATNRARMRSHPRTPAVARELLLTQDRYAEENKFLGTYAEMGIDDDGRVRCEYKQTGVVKAPGRLSSAAVLWGTGTNLQNQPERSHQMFVADRHCGFTYFDLSQAEARYVGWLAPIPAWIEQFEQARLGGNYDCHRALASVMYNVPYESVPAYDYDENHKPTIRYKSKRCRHALNYRMMPDRLAQELGITYPEAEDLFNIYHKTNPELRVWWKDTIEDVRRNRALYNSYGRRWILLERFDEDALESVIAFKPQSTIGDKVSRCIYLCESDPDWPHGRARIALNIHDALVALHYLDNATCEAVRVVMERHALEPITVRGYDGVERELIIPAEFKRSVADETGHHRWSTLKKVEHVTSSHTQTSGLVLH